MNNKLNELLNVIIYALAIVGGIIICAYFFEVLTSRSNSLSFVFIEQVLMYIGAITLCVIAFLTNVITEKASEKLRLGLFYGTIYILALAYFSQCPVNPFKSILNFIIVTIWVIAMILIFIGGWQLYKMIIGKKYDVFIKKYKDSL